MKKEEILTKVNYDLPKAKAIHQWLNEGTQGAEAQPTRVVSPFIDGNGKKWVHICAGKFDFLFDINDLTDKELNFEDANKLAEENGMYLNPKHEWELIEAFREDVDAVIEELGGTPLHDWYWSGSEYSGYYAWYFFATNGRLFIDGKMSSYGVRASLAFDKHL